jgi:hypothetical protein
MRSEAGSKEMALLIPPIPPSSVCIGLLSRGWQAD